MDRLVLAPLPSQQLVGAVREHLVAIHVVRGTGTGLVGIDDELVAVPAGQHFIGGLDDRVGEFGIQTPGFPVCQGGGFLDEDDGVNEGGKGSEIGDREVLPCALGLDAPQRLGRHGHLSQRITFHPCLIHCRHHASLSSAAVGIEPRIAHRVCPR